jgi:tRNA-splicing ligase RtcB
MPDAHKGYSAPIGAVLALKDWVVPAWVGYDIGCGVCAINTCVKRETLGDLKELHARIHTFVPCGDSYHGESIPLPFSIHQHSPAIRQALEKRKVYEQFASLGGGNHFIELGEDEKKDVWIIIHSGSRGFGHEVATYWMTRQEKETSDLGWYAYSREGLQYIHDMDQCLNYALENRKAMIRLVLAAMNVDINLFDLINRNHNHLDYSHGLFIHRKGATHAEKNMLGVIPGNMQVGSYITRGLGNRKALWSSSHGAGRRLSRTQAKAQLDFEEFKRQMAHVVGDVTENRIDEAPDAYKNLGEVISTQVKANILEVVSYVQPFLNVKG